MSVTHEDIYYLDPWFVAREYEIHTHKPLPSTVSRSTTSGLEGNLMVIKAKGATQETVVFEQTPESAFWEIFTELSAFPEVENMDEKSEPSIFWIEGILSVYGSSDESKGKLMEDGWTFCLVTSNDNPIYIRLLSNQSFFRYNIDEYLIFPRTLGIHCKMKVRVLMKSHGNTYEEKAYVATPLIILTNKNG